MLTYEDIKRRLQAGENSIDLSIEKWEVGIKEELWDELEASNNCALCHLYWGECNFCPITQYKESECCIDTNSTFYDFQVAPPDFKKEMAQNMLGLLKYVKQDIINRDKYKEVKNGKI